MVIRRGEIWWADLPAPGRSEPGYRRPVIVIQSDAFNRSRIQTVLAISVTSNTKLAEAAGNVLLPRGQTRLGKDSVANVSQIITVDKGLLEDRIGKLPQGLMLEIEAGLRLVMEL